MILKKKIFALIICFVGVLQAQELKVNVIVNTDQLEKNQDRIDQQILTDMKTTISSFLNNYKWTDHTFQTNEKINCTFQINISSHSGTTYAANVQVVANRPIYNTNYESQIFNFLDKDWVFEYSQSTSINYSENAYVNQLSSLLSFYAYMILAYDYDSYAKFGGQQYLEKAQQILNSAQTSGGKGWTTTEGSNVRAWLIENLTNPQQQTLREVMYKYHRQVLDKFTNNQDDTRKILSACLDDLKQMNSIRPNSLTLKWFFNMKENEIVNIYSKAPQDTKQKTFLILSELDPTNIEKYNNIFKNN